MLDTLLSTAKAAFDWLVERFFELSSWQGIAAVVGSLILFGVFTHPVVLTITKWALAAGGTYLIVKKELDK